MLHVVDELFKMELQEFTASVHLVGFLSSVSRIWTIDSESKVAFQNCAGQYSPVEIVGFDSYKEVIRAAIFGIPVEPIQMYEDMYDKLVKAIGSGFYPVVTWTNPPESSGSHTLRLFELMVNELDDLSVEYSHILEANGEPTKTTGKFGATMVLRAPLDEKIKSASAVAE